MKILVAILTHDGTQSFADACIKTWVRDIQKPHEYYFYGSKAQSEKMGRTWNCEPDDGELRERLPEKTYKMLIESLNHEWDFLFKCDDDTFVVFDKLVNLLKNYNFNDDLYIGCKIVNPFSYGQGGAGYALTRSAAKKCVNFFKHYKIAEDQTVGFTLKEQNINLTNTNLLSTPSPKIAKFGNNQSVCIDAILKDNKITTHYVKPDTMKKIYDIFKK